MDPAATDTTQPGPTVGAKVARAVLQTSISQVLLIVIGFASSIAQARLLGAEGRGDVTRFMNAGALAVLCFGLGINSAITYFSASGAVQPRALLRTLRPAFVFTVGGVAVCSGLAAWTPLRRFLPESLAAGALVVALTLFFTMSQLANWLSAVLAARRNFTPMNMSMVVIGAAGAVASLGMLWLRPAWAGADAIIMLNVALEALRAALLGLAFWPRKRSAAEAAAIPAQAASQNRAAGTALGLGRLLQYSLLTCVGDSLQFLTYRFDMWVVDAYRGAADLGRYSLAVSLAQLVWIVPSATARVLFPYSAMLSRPEAAVLVWRSARISLAVCALAAGIGWAGAQLFLTALFGPQFSEVPALLGILLLGVVPCSVFKVLGNYMAGIGAVRANVLINGAGLAIAIVLDFLLIPYYGATGAAWATAISYTLSTLLLYAVFLRKSALSLRATLGWRFTG